MSVVVAPEVTWTKEAIEGVILDLLGRLIHEDPDELRRRLLEKGSLMPVDSLDLFDVLQEFRQATGLSVQVRQLGRQTMRSVGAFSEFVAERANQ